MAVSLTGRTTHFIVHVFARRYYFLLSCLNTSTSFNLSQNNLFSKPSTYFAHTDLKFTCG